MTIKLLEDAEQLGIKLEIVGDTPTWEAFPMLRHQGLIYKIESSIRTSGGHDRGCGCFHYSDVFVQFADGSVKRPDISVFCQEPLEKDSPVTMMPDAVVEVLSRGYKGKDLKVGVPFYLRQGVKDVVVVDPRSGRVLHFAGDERRELQAPVTLELACGCRFDVPAPTP
ncbi:MAG: Uma2 family endonuclease [Armatimonadetes bacterium]|nr:Uma2 family endonuclease [Armatimonadota bacterium]